MRVEGLEVHVKETEYRARRSWGGDIHAECIPPVPAMQLHAEDVVKHQLPPSLALLVEQRRAKTLAGEQRHGCEWSTLERRVDFGFADLEGEYGWVLVEGPEIRSGGTDNGGGGGYNFVTVAQGRSRTGRDGARWYGDKVDVVMER